MNDNLIIDPDKRQLTAEQNFLKGYNCCQSVLLTYSDIIGLDEKTILSIGSGFGGGMSRLREVCGSVSAMAVIAGFIIPADDPTNMALRTENYALVQALASRFKEHKGSIICREILGLRKSAPENPRPSDRTPEYYKSRPCAAVVGLSARIIAEYLKENYQTNYQ